MDKPPPNKKYPSSSSSTSSSSTNQRSSSNGILSSNNSWCSLESVPPPTPFDEKSPSIPPSSPLKHPTPSINHDEDDDDEYTGFFTNPCVIDDHPQEEYAKDNPDSSTILYCTQRPQPPALIFPSEDSESKNGTLSTHVSASTTDSGGASEEEARLSSAPLCSSVPPEHTLSDISGPCSSSIVFQDGMPGGVLSGCGGESSGVVTASTSIPVVLGSTTTSTSSSLSDTDDERILGVCSGRNKHEYDLLPPPPPEEEVDLEDEFVPMDICCEDYWTRLHDVRINGCILEYTGIGKSLHDNGFAQSNVPLTPLNHYFEMTIINPGEHCYIAVGLARKDYNVRKNPGWCSGSIAYHTDDGKIFIGGGSGTPFGPRCMVNDTLGCGIIFPLKYAELPEGSTWPWEMDKSTENLGAKARLPVPPPPQKPTRHRRKARSYGGTDNFGRISSDEDDESEDDIWWDNSDRVCEDKVKVFFMRNRKLLGMKEVRIPKGGFYPTIGMMSTNERVSVDLHPLSG